MTICTGTPVSMPNLPTGTVDNLSAILPLTIGMPSTPQTIQASLLQLYAHQPDVQVYTVTGSHTWTKPDNLLFAIVEVIGGGGGGGGAAATGASQMSAGRSGGGGGYSRKKILAADLGSTETVIVGAGGAGASAGGNGGTGATSSFGSHLQATGGQAGSAGGALGTQVALDVPVGGAGSGGDINVKGGASTSSMYLGGTSFCAVSGNGGNTVYGAGGAGVRAFANTVAGQDGGAYGGGGSGGANSASQSAQTGGAGANGIVIVWEYKIG